MSRNATASMVESRLEVKSARGRPTASVASDPLDDELKELLLAIRQKSSVSFESVYVMISSRLFAVVSNVKADRAEAEAVLQEVFVNIWHECDLFDADKDDPIEWLVALARRTALSSVRHRSRSTRGDSASPRRDSRAFTARGTELPEPVNIVVRGHVAAQANPALTTLSPEQRAGLTLAFYDCLSPDEIFRRLCGRPMAASDGASRDSAAATQSP